MQSPEIRPAQPADLEAISKIERENFSFPWHYADFARMCGEKEKLLLCASSEAGCLGYIGAYLLPDGAEIMTVAVDAAARGRGIGKKLVLAALRTLQDHGVPPCISRCARATPPRGRCTRGAVLFSAACGAAITKGRPRTRRSTGTTFRAHQISRNFACPLFGRL